MGTSAQICRMRDRAAAGSQAKSTGREICFAPKRLRILRGGKTRPRQLTEGYAFFA